MDRSAFHLSLGLFAVLSFACLTGCEQPAPTAPSDAATSDEHAADHDHADHDHADHDHDHADHDHGDHDHAHEGDHDHDFESLDEATAEIESLFEEIGKQFADGDAEAAHEPLHHIGSVLIATEDFLKTMDDSERKTQLAAAVDSLLDDFTAIDEQLHVDEPEEGGPAKKFESLKESIETSIATLKAEESES